MTFTHFSHRLRGLQCAVLLSISGLAAWPASSQAASPRCSAGLIWHADTGSCMSPPSAPVAAPTNSADLPMQGNIHVDMTIYQGANPSQGCNGGYTFLAGWGGCVRTTTETDTQRSSCAAGYTGTLTSFRTRTVYTHQRGTIQHGPWSGWSAWSGACTPIPVTPPVTPPVVPPIVTTGVTFTDTISAFVCGPGDPGWNSFNTTLGEAGKAGIVSYYRNLPGHLGRCPEVEGFEFFRTSQFKYASWFRQEKGLPEEFPMSWAWNPDVQKSVERDIKNGAQANQRAFADARCLQAAQQQFSNVISAVFVDGTGKQCRVTGIK